jgi:hypothetical protein
VPGFTARNSPGESLVLETPAEATVDVEDGEHVVAALASSLRHRRRLHLLEQDPAHEPVEQALLGCPQPYRTSDDLAA